MVLVWLFIPVGTGSSENVSRPEELPLPTVWPPRVGESYPNLVLRDPEGRPVHRSSYRGKVLLIELIGLTCSACNAFAGAGENGIGGFRGIQPQNGLASIESYVESYGGGVRIDDPGLVLVQILFFDTQNKVPTLEDARDWVNHFRLDLHPNLVVLVGDERFLNRQTRDLIPGFQLVDRNFILRSDSAGHSPTHNLYKHLLPRIGELLRTSGGGQVF